MQKIFLINGKPFITNSAGLKRMGRETLAELDKIVDKGELLLLYPKCDKGCFPEFINIMKEERGSLDKRFWTTTILNRFAKETKRTVVNMIAPYSSNRHSIITIADVRYMEKDHNGKYYDGFVFRFKCWLTTVIGIINADAVVTISEFSKNRINRHFKVPKEKIHVIPCGWQHYTRIEEDESVFNRFPAIEKGGYFFTVGTLAPHKNHKWVEAAAEMNPDELFVICGGIEKAIFDKGTPRGSRKNLIFTGRISDGEMKALMKNAKAFIFPSLYEGFGLPPLEALSVGTECIVSDIPVHRELFGDSVHYIDPLDADVDLENLINEDLPISKEDILIGFSWEQAAHQWEQLIRGK